jgi:hypothetical protein
VYLHVTGFRVTVRPARAPAVPSSSLLLALSCLAWLHGSAARPAAALDDDPAPAAVAAAAPTVAGATATALRWRLHAAFRLAVARLAQRPQCRGLFDGFAGEGLDLLRRAVYFAAAHHTRPCRRGAAAFTRVGGGPVGLCDEVFVGLDRRAAARTLIHEALHHAGQSENPPDPRAPSPFDLDQLVGRRCGL